MLFNSFEFVFVFLPIVLAGYVVLSQIGGVRWVIAFLVLSSLFFYGWWDPVFLPLVILSKGVNFFIGLRVARGMPGARAFLIGGVTFNLLLLAYFKYVGFFGRTVEAIFATDFPVPSVVLPIGISFFTFQQIAYLVDSYRGIVRETNFFRYALFVLFFPQLIAGPIVHHSEILPQLHRLTSTAHLRENLAFGISYFVLGLFKKVILADSAAVFASPVFGAADGGIPLSTFEAWGGLLAYTLQLYFDFSAYSDMAIGLAYMFGIRLPLNFNSPYKSVSIIEFWRRWHMTLSRFLRDYLYFALGGNRYGSVRRYINLIITMLLGGLWHGAGWNFVIWGGLHGMYLVIAHGLGKPVMRLAERVLSIRGVAMAGCCVTLFMVMIAWVFFRSTSLAGAMNMLNALFCVNGCSVPMAFVARAGEIGATIEMLGLVAVPDFVLTAGDWLVGWPFLLALLAVALLAPNTQEIMGYRPPHPGEAGDRESAIAERRGIMWKPTAAWAALLSGLALASVMNLTRPSEFLYFQF